MATPREAIADAAFRLFAERGYDATSVDDIAAEAGVSRSTFFRSYGSKEAVIFPDHQEISGRVEWRLQNAPGQSALRAVTEAVKTVLAHYMAEGERARERYRLTSAVPVLRERELVSGAEYQTLFHHYLNDRGDGSEQSELRAELMAASVVAAHNRVLRRWLRGESQDAEREVEEALAVVHRLFEPGTAVETAAVVVVPEGYSLHDAEAAIRRALFAASKPPDSSAVALRGDQATPQTNREGQPMSRPR